MADPVINFSCKLDTGSAEKAKRAIAIAAVIQNEINQKEERDPGFEISIDTGEQTGVLWLHSDEYGEPEDVVAFVLRCAEVLDLKDRWGFCWNLSRPRLDGFGGSAVAIDLNKRVAFEWVDTETWLTQQLDGPTLDTGTLPTEPTGEATP